MNNLGERLLRQDGIDPRGTADELTGFRTLLAREQARAQRLRWVAQIPILGMSLLLVAVCVGERLWDRLHIPFATVFGLAVIGIWVMIIFWARPLARRLERITAGIAHLKRRLPEYASSRLHGVPLVGREGHRRLIFWPGVLLMALVASLIAVVAGNAVWLVLTRRLSGSVTAWQVLFGLLMTFVMVWHALRVPVDELREWKHLSRLFWVPAPAMLTWRIPRAVRTTFLTLVLVILGVFSLIAFFQANTVYARVLATAQRARYIHAVGYGFDGGTAVQQSEIWYRRGEGTRIQWQRGEQIIDRYDDGGSSYEYVQGMDYAVKKPRRGSLLPSELVAPLRYLKGSRRDPSRDEIIGGGSWACYRRETGDHRALMWVDPATRFRRYEEYERLDGQWQQVELVEVDYDGAFELEMPPAVFERQGIRVTEPGRVLEARYGLGNVLASTEILGLTFAVHELRQCGQYRFITCSVRPTEQSRSELAEAGYAEALPDHVTYGGFNLSSWWQRRDDGSLESRPYAITELGHLRLKGVDVRWYALLPRGQWPGRDTQLEVCAYVRTDAALRELRQGKGLDSSGQFRPLLTVPLPERQSDLAAVGTDLYGLGHLVTNISMGAQDLFVSDSSGVGQGEFQQRLEGLLTGLRPMGELWDRVGSGITIQLLEERDAPVEGALIGAHMQWSDGRIQSTKDGRLQPPLVSDEEGSIRLMGPQLFDRGASQDTLKMLYVVHPNRQLSALYAVSGRDFGRSISITMRRGCRVRASLTSLELPPDAKMITYTRVRTSVRRRHSLNSLIVPILTHVSKDGSFEVLLPPGEYELGCHGTHDGSAFNGYRRFEVLSNTHELDLGTVALRGK